MAKTPVAPANMSILFTRRRFFEAACSPASAMLTMGGKFPAISVSDSVAPSVPANVQATSLSGSSIQLTWSASTDTGGSGLAGYRIYRDSNPNPLTSTTSTTITDTGLTQGTQYSYRVTAYDNVGNESAQSSAASATTQTSAGPLILYTNTVAGPVTGGENGLGCYLFIYGLNFGTFADYGVTNFVTIGGVAVANYRYLKPAVGPVGTTVLGGIQCLAVQVGNLTGLTLGTAYPISVTVGGQTPVNSVSGSHYLDLDGVQLDFTPNPGGIKFVALTNGAAGNPSDSNSGNFGAPYRHLQAWNGSTFSGAVFGPGGVGNTSNQIPPGTHIYLMGGDYGADISFGSRWCDWFARTGLAPTGATNTGPIVVSHYPGAAGANAPEVVQWLGVSGSNGGFNGADTQRSGLTPPWPGAPVGYCKWLHISNLYIRSHPSSASDGAPVNLQTAADFNRVVNCELEWRSTLAGGTTAAGIAGEGTWIYRYGNYIHHIFDASGNQQNHGIYIGTNTGATGAAQAEYHGITAYNYISDINGGSGIQSRGPSTSLGAAADSAPWPSFHHNTIDTVVKHGINMFDNRGRAYIWANTLLRVAQSPFFTNSDNVSVAGGIYFGFNTIYDWGSGTFYPACYSNGGNAGGSVRVESNVFYQVARSSSPAFNAFFTSSNGCPYVFNKNLWYNTSNTALGVPSGDSPSTQTNPLFTDAATGNFTPAISSPMINAGQTPPTPGTSLIAAFDALGRARPQSPSTSWARGAYERPS